MPLETRPYIDSGTQLNERALKIKETIESTIGSPERLWSLIAPDSRGHTHIHCPPSDSKTSSIAEIFMSLQKLELPDFKSIAQILPDVDGKHSANPERKLVDRIISEDRAFAMFTNKNTAIASLAFVLSKHAGKIAKWSTSFDKQFRLTLTDDVGAVVGGGIRPNGEERLTTSVSLVLERASFEAGLPFRIVTMYPNTNEMECVGTLCSTGKSYAPLIADSINEETDVGIRMYWAAKDYLSQISSEEFYYDPICFAQMMKGRLSSIAIIDAVVPCDNTTHVCSFRYNNNSRGSGQVFIRDEEDGMHKPIFAVSNPPFRAGELYKNARDIERQILCPLLEKAATPGATIVKASSPLFSNERATQIETYFDPKTPVIETSMYSTDPYQDNGDDPRD